VAPIAGPVVSAPLSAGELPVSGAAALPPGTGPDGHGVVLAPRGGPAVARSPIVPAHRGRAADESARPDLGGRPGRGSGSARMTGFGASGLARTTGFGGNGPAQATRVGPGGHLGGTELAAGGGAGTPRRRWEAAVSARPLEAPRPLPSAFHALARAVTGRARPPRYTTGSATRGALAAAGALGATTGTVVHLPRPPATPADAAVLAHELTHTRSPVRRPRFLLSGASGLLDDDERQALAAGRGAAESVGAGIVGQLPVGGGMGAVADVAVRAAKAAVIEAGAAPLSGGSSWAAGTGDAGFSALAASGPAAATTPGPASPDAPGGPGPGETTGPQPAPGTAPAGGAVAAPLDPDRVMEIIEERLLREIERRGGRWAGVF